MAKLDLTLREVAEAKEYGITTKQYEGFRAKLEDRLKKKLTPEVEKVKADYLSCIRREVTRELTPKIREELIGECRKAAEAELRGKVTEELRKEASSRVPNEKDLEAVREFVREAELDCMTQAHAASADAEEAKRGLKWTRALRGAGG